MSDLTATFTNYFTTFRNRHPDVDMVFTGCAPYEEEAKNYAKEKGWSFIDCGCCSKCTNTHADNTLSSLEFEEALIEKYLPSVAIPALTAAAEATGAHIVFHVDSVTVNCDGYEQHSIVFKPGPEGWIQDLYRDIAKGKLMAAAPNGLENGVYRTVTLTYPGIYAQALTNLMRDYNPTQGDTRLDFFNRQESCLLSSKFDAQWLRDVRVLMKENLCFEFEYGSCDDGPSMGCKKCSVVMCDDQIVYNCHCPDFSLDTIDDEVAATRRMWK